MDTSQCFPVRELVTGELRIASTSWSIGVLGAPYGPALRAAMDRRDARRARGSAADARPAGAPDEPAAVAAPAEAPAEAVESVAQLERAEVAG